MEQVWGPQQDLVPELPRGCFSLLDEVHDFFQAGRTNEAKAMLMRGAVVYGEAELTEVAKAWCGSMLSDPDAFEEASRFVAFCGNSGLDLSCYFE